MLVALCLILALNLGSSVKTYVLFNIVILDWLMLFFGLLGETGFISLFLAMFFGFISFFIMFWIIYKNFIFGKKNESNQFIYWLYFGLWLGYGIIYGIDPVWKTIITNILDCIAKAFFAIWFVISNLLV
jgi:hypothetical protein